MVKPFSPAELVARVDAVLRRSSPTPEPEAPVDLGWLSIDAGGAPRHGRAARTSSSPSASSTCSRFLARHPGHVFSRDQLMDAVWQYAFYTDTSTVTVHVRRLRAKIELDPADPRYLQTVWGVGYRFQP